MWDSAMTFFPTNYGATEIAASIQAIYLFSKVGQKAQGANSSSSTGGT